MTASGSTIKPPAMAFPRVFSQPSARVGVAYLGAYVLLDWVSFIQPYAHFGITPWNPSTGLSFVLVLLFGQRFIPLLFVSPLLADLVVRQLPLSMPLELATSAVIGSGYSAGLLLLLRPGPPRPDRTRASWGRPDRAREFEYLASRSPASRHCRRGRSRARSAACLGGSVTDRASPAQSVAQCGRGDAGHRSTHAYKKVVGLTDEIVASDERLMAYMRANVGTYCHALGTAPVGSPKDGGVVDQHCKVHGIENLYVVDASIFPFTPRTVPNFTIMMFGERVGGWLAES